MADFDVIVIGSGPGGYVCAIKCAQLGLKTACVEKDKTLGGTCLNVGCIPSKALLDSSEHYEHAKHKLANHGVLVKDVGLDIATMMKRKDKVVAELTGGVEFLFKKKGITRLTGLGRFASANTVEVKGADGTTKSYTAKNIIIATGSEPSRIPTAVVDGKRIVTSTEALCLPKVPESLLVIGGGAIGLEMGSVWLRLGAKVTVVEFAERIAGASDKQASTELQKILTKQGMVFKTSTKVTKVENAGSKCIVEVEAVADGKKEKLEAEVVLVSVGRRAFTDGLGLENIGLVADKAGKVEVNENFETKVKGVYAIGDVIRGPMLAHKAEDEGIAVAEIIMGQHGHVNYNVIPNVIYTWPELASVGLSEEECKAKGLEFKTGSFPFMANGRAKALGDTDGFVKVIADAKTDKILGVHIVGPRASDMIAEAAGVMEFHGSAEDMARTCHAHPTLPEVMKEAAMAVSKTQIHM